MGSTILAPNSSLTKVESMRDGSSAGFEAVGTLPNHAEDSNLESHNKPCMIKFKEETTGE